jgi:hypothetical protein
VNAQDVVKALRVHYGDAYAVIEQVAAGTGWQANRHLDVVAVGVWPSRGLEIHGVEVKVSRADLKRELKSPAKAEEVAKYCDRFWIAAPEGVVHADMLLSLAPGWGILEVEDRKDGHRVRITRPAQVLTPTPVDRGFAAALLRRLPSPTEEMRAAIREEERARADEAFESRVQYEVDRRMRGAERTVDRVRAFEEASGISLDEENERWRWLKAADIGAAVEFIARDRGQHWSGYASRLKAASQTAKSVSEQLRTIADSLADAATDIGSEEGQP